MRTNVNIADDAREFAQVYAHANGITLGDAITELIRKGQQAQTRKIEGIQFEHSSAGFPVIPRTGRRITTEMVRRVEEEELV
jgi:hypothetical protein